LSKDDPVVGTSTASAFSRLLILLTGKTGRFGKLVCHHFGFLLKKKKKEKQSAPEIYTDTANSFFTDDCDRQLKIFMPTSDIGYAKITVVRSFHIQLI
jgi:hypothetical protein